MHRHSFKQTGAGCMVVGNDKFPCDIQYKCDCGENFGLETTITGYQYLPHSFETQPPTEMLEESLKAINDAKLGIPLDIEPPNT